MTFLPRPPWYAETPTEQRRRISDRARREGPVEFVAAPGACKLCVPLDGQRWVSLAAMTAAGMVPPLHPHCHCRVLAAEEAEHERNRAAIGKRLSAMIRRYRVANASQGYRVANPLQED